MKELGYGRGYRYAHDFPGAYVPQAYLPDRLLGAQFYQPGDAGYEARVRERLEAWRRQAAEAGPGPGEPGRAGGAGGAGGESGDPEPSDAHES